ncbi:MULTISPECIES: helix-turn-helix domain-containing protein [unclassified Methanoregula]|uniref:helix-turn-helix domain-containing protein n=1 Tax=unclassified Methanoregula TaxID=2649730 RepID=UPI0009CC2C64|nr:MULTISPECIES: helix-turn-helix domain-containing protein [unclassified Methanoregula]OPX62650.1 MAG: helix-turn-helix protein [Methanoregula sp. PtaB.Bin085]OPY33303.1 MAG: helix-turn-helix protein [Methanoregula sp. PtaU1.Bin006]
MLSKRIFETDFTTALNEELERKNMTVKDLAEQTGIPVSTLYKVTVGERDPRLSTIKKIVSVLEPGHDRFIAVIAARFLLDSLDRREIESGGRRIGIRGYSANSLEECIIAAVRAEKDGAAGIVCAPILASIVEKIVDIPVVMLRPDLAVVSEAMATLARKVG